MANLEDFLIKLDNNAQQALNEYNFLVDEVSLDYLNYTPNQPVVQDEFKQVDVALDFTDNSALIRAATQNDLVNNSLRIWYLPWKNPDNGGMSKAELSGAGPGIFLTSQLTGCRFTIQYHGADMKKATVLHLAGTYGLNAKGATERERIENSALEDVPGPDSRRRYSIGKYSKKPKFAPDFVKLNTEGTRHYYDGDKATVLGVRGNDAKWRFFAQQYNNSDAFVSLKEL